MPLKQIMYGFQGKRPLLFIDGTVQHSYHRPAPPILYCSNNTNIWGTSVWWMEEPLGNAADRWTEDHTRDGTKHHNNKKSHTSIRHMPKTETKTALVFHFFPQWPAFSNVSLLLLVAKGGNRSIKQPLVRLRTFRGRLVSHLSSLKWRQK